MKADSSQLMEKVTNIAKRRGFVFPSAEIYGGLNGFWDYGPIGVELKNNIKRLWWSRNVRERDDVVGLDAAIITNPAVWRASGHTEHFKDQLVECKNCHNRYRIEEKPDKCPVCGKGDFTQPHGFNTMFKTYVGPVEDEGNLTYLRPETAQGMFVNFKNVLETSRKKIPFGIAQIGKSFRNEITTGNFIFRLREFEQMELEFFVKPGEDEKWHEYWKKERLQWYLDLGIKKTNVRLRDYKKAELAHYSKATADVEYDYPFGGWGELEGIANRTDYDLRRHMEASGKDLTYFDEETKEKFVPFVVEPAVGIDRIMLALMLDAYDEDKDKDETRTVLRLNPKVAPVKVAVFPLQKDEHLLRLSQEIFKDLRFSWNVQYDQAGSIGRRYRRQDEIGTPYCVTVDFDSITDRKVTVRERDSMKQERVKIADLKSYLTKALTA
jgi:glycyl-tRNA synthetase